MSLIKILSLIVGLISSFRVMVGVVANEINIEEIRHRDGYSLREMVFPVDVRCHRVMYQMRVSGTHIPSDFAKFIEQKKKLCL